MKEKEMILLVDENDKEMGYGEKHEVHKKGLFHRAFSIFIFNSKNQLLLQKREKNKYHSPGLWTNTCCSHQRQNEELSDAIHRRLKEEMGFDTELKEAFTFSYNFKFHEELSENEFDHVYIGHYEGDIIPNPQEVEDYKWVDLEELKQDIEKNPDKYTYWFKICFPKVASIMEK
ncbi:isopentenyl-diphosphate Delta-isomerase [Clostridium polynesiense]|uniref:isopentenyl-diphosphate Delta-isomerase n=1 Tax=Clostridium polynesiense TaxID=1325933 RepID=UPI00058F0B1F|nr:isopentenyl-diphosphate Delta-isomerase [Clostridium polynesiense]